MIIKRITLNNFRQYKGRQIVEFAVDKKLNVTVILGSNTSDKTALIQAFNWCLYGKTIFKSIELLNADVKHQLKIFTNADVSVELEIVKDERLYIIQRTQGFFKANMEMIRPEPPHFSILQKDPNGETEEFSDSDCTSIVENILPERLSSYFFFSGEHINETNNKFNLIEAIHRFLGVDVIYNTVNHFNPSNMNSVISKLRNSLDLPQNKWTEKLKSHLFVEKQQLESDTIRRDQLIRQIQTLKDEIDEIDKILLASKDAKQMHEEINEELVDNIDTRKYEEKRSDLKNLLKQIQDLFTDIEVRIGECLTGIENMEELREEIAFASDKNIRTLKSIHYAKKVYERFIENYEKYEKEIRDSLQENIKRIFNEMYHGQCSVELDDKYHIVLKVADENSTILPRSPLNLKQ